MRLVRHLDLKEMPDLSLLLLALPARRNGKARAGRIDCPSINGSVAEGN